MVPFSTSSALTCSIRAIVLQECSQTNQELQRRGDQLQQLLDYCQGHDLDARLAEGLCRCLQSSLRALDLARREAQLLSSLDPTYSPYPSDSFNY